MSRLVPMKHLKESSIEQTIGSPLTLKEVLTSKGGRSVAIGRAR